MPSEGQARRVAADEDDTAGKVADALLAQNSNEPVIVSRVAAAKKWAHLSPRSAMAKEEAIQKLATLPDADWRDDVDARAKRVMMTVRPPPKAHRKRAAVPSAAVPSGAPPAASQLKQQADEPVPSPIEPAAAIRGKATVTTCEVRPSAKAVKVYAAEAALAKVQSRAAAKHAAAAAAKRRVRAVRLAKAYGSAADAPPRAAPANAAPMKSSISAPVLRTLGGYPLSFSQVERTAPGGSFSRLPRFEPAKPPEALRQQGQRQLWEKRAPPPHDELPALLPLLLTRGGRSLAPTRALRPPRSPPAPLLPTHAAAAAAAVAAVAREKAERRQAVAQRSSRAHSELAAKEASAETEAKSAIAHGKEPYVAQSVASKKWPGLSPRAALQKEQLIQQLASLPPEMTFATECSESETHAILNG